MRMTNLVFTDFNNVRHLLSQRVVSLVLTLGSLIIVSTRLTFQGQFSRPHGPY